MAEVKTIALADIIPRGGNWRCAALPGAITRSIWWGRIEVANVNPCGDLDDKVEGNIAMGLAAMPAACMALRMIRDRANPESEIGQIARIAIEYIERPAPAISEPEEEE